ncbi:MAG TPA: outer membrane beta-barrel protein, partial [Croceibacterium sp.]
MFGSFVKWKYLNGRERLTAQLVLASSCRSHPRMGQNPVRRPTRRGTSMRKLGIAIATAATAIASPAIAGDDQDYFGVEAGMIFPDDVDLEMVTTGAEVLLEPDNGWDADLLLGHDFGGFRIEAEVGYKSFDVDSFTSTAVVPVGTFSDAGDVTVISSMLNGLIDFGGNDGVGFSIGGGAGVSRVQMDLDAAGLAWMDQEDLAFSWQGVAALRVPLSPSVDLGIKYRYFNVEDIEVTSGFRQGYETDLSSHSILLSML